MGGSPPPLPMGKYGDLQPSKAGGPPNPAHALALKQKPDLANFVKGADYKNSQFYVLSPVVGGKAVKARRYPPFDFSKWKDESEKVGKTATNALYMAKLTGLDKKMATGMGKQGPFGAIIELNTLGDKLDGGFSPEQNYINLSQKNMNATSEPFFSSSVLLHEWAHQAVFHKNSKKITTSMADSIADEANSFAYEYAGAYLAKLNGKPDFWKHDTNEIGVTGEGYKNIALRTAKEFPDLEQAAKIKNFSVIEDFLQKLREEYIKNPMYYHLLNYDQRGAKENGNSTISINVFGNHQRLQQCFDASPLGQILNAQSKEGAQPSNLSLLENVKKKIDADNTARGRPPVLLRRPTEQP